MHPPQLYMQTGGPPICSIVHENNSPQQQVSIPAIRYQPVDCAGDSYCSIVMYRATDTGLV